ncbi:hypothetical protein C1I98_21255 [Spongiactinospora gelatinilytica]|uniref:Lantibiotic dehydratase N-terminal domain-containing protein n=1 Tax=Spongiactinospora gelatinilytica TaxID=2666298 RepID=A0A2W2GW03_9ACTN|nr:lantibiotic dehydratase [Spongiactinospora gelatinilytica]PZG41438.1 hypothetical protein C1I98_21255 [Spongiactinospora gelatinilytica]
MIGEAVRPVRVRPLGPGWTIWDTFVVRPAGLPFDWLTLADGDLRAQPLFREALAWQNPRLTARLRSGRGRERPSDRRAFRRAIRSYAQRYCAKNDTIGFFGPAAWGAWSEGGTAITPAGRPPRSRRTSFELWAVQAIADALELRHELTPWTVVHLAPGLHRSEAGVMLADGSLLRAAGDDLRLIALVDGRRSGADLAAEYGPQAAGDVARRLARLRAMGILTSGFAVRRGVTPERALRGQLLRVSDTRRRAAALADLDALVAARDEVAAAAGDDAAVERAQRDLRTAFTGLTSQDPDRRHAEFYAGRTLVYEDSVADLDVRLGTGVLARLTAPLTLLLDSSLWFCNTVADAYERLVAERFGAHARRAGGVPLAAVLNALDPMSVPGAAGPADVVAAELTRRWSALLGAPAEGPAVRVRSAALLGRAAASFAAGEPRWTRARWQSPDVMFAAASQAELAAGRYLAVLGELHAGLNATDHQPFDQAHPDRAALHARIAADTEGKFVPLYRLRGSILNSRTMPPDCHLPASDTYLGTGGEPPYQPAAARTIPVAALRVHLDGETAVVRTVTGEYVAGLTEVIGDQLSHAVAQRFAVLPPAPYQPRVAIDELVVSRERWRLPLRELPRAVQGPRRLAAALEAATSARHRHLFAAVAGERKPFLVDVESDASLEVLAHRLTRRADEHPDEHLTLTEMLPGPGDLWFRDDLGRRYTAEFRFVCVREAVSERGEEAGRG